MMFKGKLLFVKSQMNQILKGGIPTLYRKIKKLLGITFMNIFAPLVVRLNIYLPKVYIFAGYKNIRKLKNLWAQSSINKIFIHKIENQTIEYFKVVVEHGPNSCDIQDWIDASHCLGGMYFLHGKMKEMDMVFGKVMEVRDNIANKNQFDKLGIEFLPRFLGVGSIGNYENFDAYFKANILGLRPFKKTILIVDQNSSINNPCYLGYWHKYVTVVSDPLLIQTLAPLEKYLTSPMHSYMSLNGKMHKSFLALGVVREKWIKENRPPILTLSDEDYQRGWQCLKSFGVKQGDWFVCLHVRERGWKDNNSSVEDFRNADIDTYKLAIKTITDAGGWVIRMGDPTMKPLLQMSRVIDYAHSNVKSDWMDVFLCAQCRFFVGTSSGLFVFAMTFGVPVVATNFLPSCCAYYLTSNDLFIPRICRLKKEDRFLNFSELFPPAIGTAAAKCCYDAQDIEVIENSEEEIKDLVDEMLKKYEGCLKYSDEDEGLQKRFKSMTFDCGKKYGDEKAVVNARIGKNFLRKYLALLPSEPENVRLNEKKIHDSKDSHNWGNGFYWKKFS